MYLDPIQYDYVKWQTGPKQSDTSASVEVRSHYKNKSYQAERLNNVLYYPPLYNYFHTTNRHEAMPLRQELLPQKSERKAGTSPPLHNKVLRPHNQYTSRDNYWAGRRNHSRDNRNKKQPRPQAAAHNMSRQIDSAKRSREDTDNDPNKRRKVADAPAEPANPSSSSSSEDDDETEQNTNIEGWAEELKKSTVVLKIVLKDGVSELDQRHAEYLLKSIKGHMNTYVNKDGTTIYTQFDSPNAKEDATKLNLSWVQSISYATTNDTVEFPTTYPIFLIPFKASQMKYEAVVIEKLSQYGEITYQKKSDSRNVYTVWYKTQEAQQKALEQHSIIHTTDTAAVGWKISIPAEIHQDLSYYAYRNRV